MLPCRDDDDGQSQHQNQREKEQRQPAVVQRRWSEFEDCEMEITRESEKIFFLY